MNVPENGPTLPTACAAELLLDLSVMRDECISAARILAATDPLDEVALEECSRLDDALAAAHQALSAGLRHVRELRART